ncbi:MAG: hypothetical protein V4530_01870 [Pseudomonadota bacterium]
MQPKNIIIRAFELAKEGTCLTVEDIRVELRREGYAMVDDHLDGRLIQKQLRGLMDSAGTATDTGAISGD